MRVSKFLKAFSLCVLVFLLLSLSALSVFADAIIVADDMFNRGFSRMGRSEDGAKTINVYTSNLAEADIDYYDRDETTDDEIYKYMYKHLELNGFGEIKKDASNQEYCTVKASTFEDECFHVFHRNIDAKNVPGYKDGYVNFLVNDYAPAINVLALCDEFSYDDNGYYSCNVIIIKVDGSAGDYYSTTTFNLYGIEDKDGVSKIGSGRLQVYYPYTDGRSISADDIELVSFSMDADGIPYTGENKSYEPVVKTETESVKKEKETKKAETKNTQETEKKSETQKADAVKSTADSIEKNGNNSLLVPILIAVVIVLVAACLALLIVLVKKKNKTE